MGHNPRAEAGACWFHLFCIFGDNGIQWDGGKDPWRLTSVSSTDRHVGPLASGGTCQLLPPHAATITVSVPVRHVLPERTPTQSHLPGLHPISLKC